MTGSSRVDSLLQLGERIVAESRKLGADTAEAVVRANSHLVARARMRAAELLEEAGSKSIGLRVIKDGKVAFVSTSDLSPSGLEQLATDALSLAKLSQPDPFAAPPEPSLLTSRDALADLGLVDESMARVGGAEAIERALAAEEAALTYDARITNSEGASFSRAVGANALVTSGGFSGGFEGSFASLSVTPLADDADGKKRRGSYWSANRRLEGLLPGSEVGREAARRTLAKLGSRKIATQEAPVVFDPDAGRAILSLLAGCISGGAIWRRASYLADRANTQVASELVTIVDDPLIVGGPGSRPFDGEGFASRRNLVIENGMLKTYLLDTYSARKLDLKSTASAARGPSGGIGVSVSNFVLQPGSLTPEALLASTPSGLYVTSMMGFGFNAVTGDFSRGASGFWIEGGELSFPVSEVTISLNLDELLRRIDAIGNDSDFRSAIVTPTFRVSAMTIAGS